MTLRTKLIKVAYDKKSPERAIEILHATNPITASLTDLVFLLRLTKPSRNNRLAYLQLEAQWWVKNNQKTLKKRLKDKGADQTVTKCNAF